MMGCKYSDFNGMCENDGEGVDEDGNCIVEDDVDPSESCSSFESNEEEDEDDWI